MKTILLAKQISLLLLFTFIISCGSDDTEITIEDDDPQTILEEEREVTTENLSNGTEKTWRIESAILRNESGTIDISGNFNVVDDEFIFKADGTFIWRPGNDIISEGTTSEETLNDYYRSPINSTYIYNEDSSVDLTALDGSFTFTVEDDETIIGILSLIGRSSDIGELELILNNKTQEDYPNVPNSGLNFTEAFTFESDGILNFAPGMIGSNADNSLFIVTREDGLNNGTVSPERIIKYNFNSGILEENLFFNGDFVSKQLHIINNQLVVIGGQFVNTYNLDFSGSPTSTVHGLAVTRMGMAVTENDAYIIGGDIQGDGQGNFDGEKVYKWDIVNESLSFVTDLPEDRFGARATIVNDKLYVFGGATEFPPNSSNNTIYIYDLINGVIATENMSTTAEFTYVDKFQNLIFIAGSTKLIENDLFIGYQTTLAVYDTENNTYTNISHNLDLSDINTTIWGLSVFNNKLYVIFGNGENTGGQFGEWSVMEATIN
ncbi:MAG: hypothetical protein COB12_13040 [Flavobacterium sp.]|nr:MAG: hypothetical protein COB12_13040 [Flavobacterium sp.]